MPQKRGYLTRFLHWCAGADPDILDNPNKYLGKIEDKRAESVALGSSQYNMGAIVFLTFLTAWSSFLWTVYVLTEDAIISAASGLVVGLIKFFWDRSVASSKSTGMAWWRLPFALPLALFFAIPLTIFIFEGYLDSTATDQHRAQVQHERERLLAEAEDRIAAYESLQQEVDSLRDRRDFFEGVAEVEEFGLPLGQAGITQEEMQRYEVDGVSGTAGCGSRCERYKSEKELAKQAYERQNDTLEGRSSTEEIKAEIDAEVATLDEASPDMISRLELLVAEAMNRPLIGALALLIIIIYCVIDLLPALQRIIERNEPYYIAVQAKAERAVTLVNTYLNGFREEHRGEWIIAYTRARELHEAASEVDSIEDVKELEQKKQKLFSTAPNGNEDPTPSDRDPVPPARSDDRNDADVPREGTPVSYTYNGFSEISFT